MSSAYCQYGVDASVVATTVPFDMGFVQFCGVFWTLVQFSFNAIFTLGALYTQRLSLLLLLLSGYLASGFNEYLIKSLVHQSRPVGTCLHTNGFPSGHAVQSMTFCTWIVLESIFHPGWSLRKRLIIIGTAIVVFVPTGPCRHILNDHSWVQIGSGMAMGLVWGAIWWLICNFIIFRYLYQIMSWKITQFFYIKNDVRPNFERSPSEGKIVEKQHVWTRRLETKKARRSFARNPLVINTVHIILIAVGIVIGIIGIALSFVKDHRDPDCDRVAPNVMLVCGIITILSYLVLVPVAMMIHRKLTDQTWYPEIVQGLLFLAFFLICESAFWAIIIKYAVSEDCHSGVDVGVVFLVIYFVFTGLLLAFLTAMYWIVDLRRLYGFKKRRPTGTEINNDEVRNAKPVPKLTEPSEKSPVVESPDTKLNPHLPSA